MILVEGGVDGGVEGGQEDEQGGGQEDGQGIGIVVEHGGVGVGEGVQLEGGAAGRADDKVASVRAMAAEEKCMVELGKLYG
jgi:hypothetical protein